MEEEQKSSLFENSTFIEMVQTSENDSMSSDGLEIDISESPRCKKEIDIEDKRVLENIEEEIERQYDEKAAKSNLTAVNVKNILKHVITNEHVWAMVRNTTEENIPDVEHAVYEPKLTRAKAKELLKNQNVPPAAMAWASSAPKSEVHILINEELPEDSDDDEYVPHEEESEDEKESGHPSDIDSQPTTPATPTSTHDNSTQTIWTEDGVFKVPQQTAVPKTPTQERTQETNENIALRTRSKLSLSDTPLEIIEEAFIPPDITTDMYDLECDDEDWKDFLKKFTRPLDEAVTGTQEDDDEADPEYNVLSDEEIDKLDKEELRQDKGVKITKRELNTLVAELFEFSEIFSNTREQQNEQQSSDNNQEKNAESTVQSTENFTVVATENFPLNTSQLASGSFTIQSDNYSNIQQPEATQAERLEVNPEVMTAGQTMLFEQQMRQHVQMLTQNYILAYKNIYFDDLASKFKDMLLSLDELSKYKTITAFRAHNLSDCVDFVKDWDEMIDSNSPEVKEMINYVAKVAKNFRHFIERKQEYIVTFPDLLMKKVSQSPAFMYPSLLPKIPFRYFSLKSSKSVYVKSEIELIALGLEQFRDYLQGKKLFRTRKGLTSIHDICHYICKYMMPNRDPKKLAWYIQRMRYLKKPNAIKYYFANNKAPTAIHFVCSVEQFGVLPPAMRPPETLPYQWKTFLHPVPEIKTIEPPPLPKPKRVAKPPAYKKPKKKKKIKISPTNNPLSPEKFSNTPILIINNFLPENCEKSEVKNTPIVIIQNTCVQKQETDKPKSTEDKQKEPEKRNRLILPKLEQVFLKSEHFGPKNKTNITVNFPTINNDNKGPPPVATARQIKKLTPELLKFKFNSKIFDSIKDLDMLPSMPFLLTPVKDQRNLDLNEPEEDPLKDVSPEIPTVEISKPDDLKPMEENSKPIEEDSKPIEEDSKPIEQDSKPTEENEIVTENIEPEKDHKKDDEDELNALMVASSTMQQKNRRLQPNLTKKAKQMREYNATLAMLCPEDGNVTDAKAKNFAQAYYDKVQERLESESPLEYQKFMEALSDHDETKSTVSDLYEKVSSVLSPKHQDLCEEFLTFLTPEQAQQIGKLVPHFMLSNMSLFLRKLEIYYSNQPAQLRRIYNSLTELTETPDITMEKVKSTILPLLRGNALLIDWFLQMFPQETPPESMMTNWEQFHDEEEVNDDDKIFETLNIPEVEDPYGGPNCICKCHKIEDEMYKSRARHCIPCGTKFLQGRVYVQTGKGLRLANVTFNSSPDSERIKRISVKPMSRPKRKSETSPSKLLMSPTKDDEPRHSNESEDDVNNDNSLKKIKTIKSFRTSSPSKTRRKPIQKTPRIKKETIAKKINLPSQNAAKKAAKQTKPQQKKIEEIKAETKEPETCKQDINESETEEMESMDTCEESSQDTLEESDDSLEEIESENSEDSNSPHEMEVSEGNPIWTREEDKVILQTFQKCGYTEHVFKDIRKLVPGRTETEIKQRFKVLMSLLKEMTTDTS